VKANLYVYENENDAHRIVFVSCCFSLLKFVF